MPEPTLDFTQLADYFANQLPPHEAARLEQFIQADPERARVVAALRLKWELRQPEAEWLIDADQAWRAVASRIGANGKLAQVQVGRVDARRGNTTSQRNLRAIWLTLTASVVAIVLVILGWRGGEHRLSTTLSGRESVYTTARGQRATITLPDGSTVMLDVASRLVVPATYAAGNRTVQLTGEALFTVQHRTESPFTVVAGMVPTQVLGTSFVVRHYATDSAVLVAVRDGRVAVRSAVVSAMQQVVVRQGGTPALTAASPDQFGFATGILALDSLSFADAIVELDRWYDADIRLGDSSLAHEPIHGRFSAGSLADLATNLEWAFDLRVVREGRVLTLYSRR